MIPKQTIDGIKAAIDVRDLVASALGEPESRSGDNHFWQCPFHEDHDPSLSATSDMYYCFGCGAHGDAVQWMMDYHNKRFVEAVKALNGGKLPDGGLSEEQAVEYARRKAERRKAQMEEAQRRYAEALRELQEARTDLRYWRNEQGRELWHERYGVTDWAINYYHLGYCPEYRYHAGNDVCVTDTLTIPFYRPATRYELANLRHRLLNPVGAGKYRPERPGMGQPLFYANLNRRDMPQVVLVEGGIKAAVLWQALMDEYTNNLYEESAWMVKNVQVVGIPGSTVSPDNVPVFAAADTVWLFLDPDAYQPIGSNGKIRPSKAEALAQKLGASKCRMVELPGKPDDLIVDGIMTPRDMYHLMRNARRAE